MTLYFSNSFCREFRKTFRKMSESETEIDIIHRDVVFYHFGRALSEIADHFGEKMGRNDRVYHGLSTVMFFRSFTEYFNAPTSTTTDVNVGMFYVHRQNLTLSVFAVIRLSLFCRDLNVQPTASVMAV